MPSPTDSNPGSSNKGKPRSRRSLLPLLIFFILLLMTASGVLTFLVRNHLNAAVGSETQTRLSSQNGFDCEYSEAQKLYPFAEGVLKVTATRVSYLSMSGTEIFGCDIQMDNPFCVIRGKYALVADSGGFFCALFDADGTVYEKQMTGAISFGALSGDGIAGLIIEQAETKGSVYLLDAAGNFLAQWNSVESGYPIAVSFSPGQNIANIALVDTDGSTMQPQLKQIALSSSEEGKDPEVLGLYKPDSTSILSDISYIGDNMTVLAGISEVYGFSGGETKSLSPKFGQILSAFTAGNRSAVIYTDGVGQEVHLECIGQDFKRTNSIALGNTFIDADVLDGKIAAAADDKIMLIDAGTMEIEKTITVDQQVVRIGFRNKDTVVVVTAGSVRELTW